MATQSAFQYCLTFVHTFTHDGVNHSRRRTACRDQLDGCLAQGHLDTWLAGAGDRTCNLLVTSHPALPPEPHMPPQKLVNIVDSADGPGSSPALLSLSMADLSARTWPTWTASYQVSLDGMGVVRLIYPRVEQNNKASLPSLSACLPPTNRHTHRHAHTRAHAHRHADSRRHTQTHKNIHRHTQTNTDTETHTCTHTCTHTDTHTDTQRHRHRLTQTHTDTQLEIHKLFYGVLAGFFGRVRQLH